MLPSFAQAFASDNMSTTLPPIRKRAVKPADDDSNKKRRLTHSPHPLRTDQDDITHQSNSTPISPIGVTVQRELIDQVRSVKQIRKKQEALIEQRRGSLGALPADDPPCTSPSGPSSSRLPPPPISFANRAINAGKKKPADLLLVDPPSHPPPFHHAARRHLALFPRSSLQPSVQSAPPTQNAFSIPMTLPRLPSNLSSGPPPAISGSRKVPPTPTRLSMQANPPATLPNGPASIPIASTLVPHTPTTLTINRAINFTNSLPRPASQIQQQNSNASTSAPLSSASNSSAIPLASAQTPTQAQAAKQAFLAPFELFYDALHDARHLKEWLNEQLARTAALTRRLEEEAARLEREGNTPTGRDPVPHVKREEAETSLSEVGVKEELERLRRRVDELEGRLGRSATANGTTTTASSSSSTSSHSSQEAYTFPQQQQQQRETPYHPPPQTQQPATLPLLPAISGRLSLSVRPELGRRLSSPGWHSLGSIRGSGTSHRTVGRGGGGDGDGHREKGAGTVAVSKSLSGPGTSGAGFAAVGQSSASRRRGRRVSISGGVVPSVGVRDREGDKSGEGEGDARGREDKPGAQEEEEGGMNVDPVGQRERDGEGEQEMEQRKEEIRK